jgi:hypothetical protein
VRDVSSGAVLLTSTNVFTKDHTPPVVSPLHTERRPDRVEVTATADGGPSGLARVALAPNVDGVSVEPIPMRRVSGDFTGPTALAATFAPVADGQRVALELQASDGEGNELAQRVPVASTGGDVRLECSAVGGSWFDLDGSRSTAAADVAVAYAWSGPFGSRAGPTAHVFFPLGVNPFALQLTETRGYTGRQASTATVVDTVPPSLTVQASPACLWPPNHKLVPLRLGRELIATARDVCDAAPSVRIVRIDSSEPVDARGDGHTSPDVSFGPAGACLRAERSGAGRDRIYRVVVEATDASGNATQSAVDVTVPHDVAAPPPGCPALPADAFVEDGDARCDFTATSKPTALAGAARMAAPASCATAPLGSGTALAFVLLVALRRRTRFPNTPGRS